MIPSILMTGSYGFIGSHLTYYLSNRGFEIHSLVRKVDDSLKLPGFIYEADLSDEKSISTIIKEISPEYIIHLASRARPGRDLAELDFQLRDTVIPTVALARGIPKSVKLSLFFGSCEEYGNGPPPFTENQSLVAMSPYGWGKISAYYAAKLILDERKIPYCWLRPFLTFGPGQRSDQLIPAVINGCLNGENVPLSPGMQTRDFMYVADICEMVYTLVKESAKATGQTINLSSSIPRTIFEVAHLIQHLCRSGTLSFGSLPYRTNEAMSICGSNQKFCDLFGRPKITRFEEAMQVTIDSYRV